MVRDHLIVFTEKNYRDAIVMRIQLDLDQDSSALPVYKRLARQIAKMIDANELRPGQVLPSTRELAVQLGLSRDTVLNAYKELNRLAYTYGEAPKGTFINQREVARQDAAYEVMVDDDQLSNFGKQLIGEAFRHPSSPTYAGLNHGAVPRSALPMRKWRGLMQELCRPETFRNLEYEPDVLGRSELREAIAGYLFRTKGIECDWRQVAIFSISSALINIVGRLLLDPGATVGVEEPGYGAIKNIAKTLELKLLPLAVDDAGLSVETLEAYAEPVKLVYVTSNHHDPTGAIMSIERRKQLISWAKERQSWIIDDDYDGHFYYDGDPPKGLWSLNPDANVIYSSTFWQLLYPLTSIGYAVIPKRLIPAVVAAKELQTEGMADSMVQLVLSKILNGGYLENHIRRTRRIFSQRRIALIYELKRQLGADIEIKNASSGCCLTVYLKRWIESEVRDAALTSDLPLVPTASYYLANSKPGEYLVNFSLHPENEAAAKVAAFAKRLGR
jgi:GntR family transcriptional regulator/MocR family aminotransferase